MKESQLARLNYENGRVLEVYLEDNKLVLEEACDMYFNVAFTKTQAIALLEELREFINRLPE